MKKSISTFSIILLFSHLLFAQDAFSSLSRQANAAYEAKDYLSAGQLLEQAFQQYPARFTKREFYNAACTWAMAGDINKAFQNLDKAIVAGWRDSEKLQYNKDLQALRSDQRWPGLMAAARQQSAPVQNGPGNPMRQQLEEIFAVHQRLRAQKDSVELSAGTKSPQFKQISQRIQEADARHLQLITSVLDTQGWPTKQKVGHFGSLAAFLTIQQAALPVQEKYLPMIRQATLQGDLSPMGYVYMQDKLLVLKNKPQMFGTQIRLNTTTKKKEVVPIDDEAHVDERRAEFGLGPLADFLKRLDINYKTAAK